MTGRFDENEYHCQVTPAVVLSPDGSPPGRARRTGELSRDLQVPFVVRDIDCDLIVGREWISLLRLVVSESRDAEALSRDSPFPSHLEESPYDQFIASESSQSG